MPRSSSRPTASLIERSPAYEEMNLSLAGLPKRIDALVAECGAATAFAERVGCSEGSVSKWRRGEARIEPEWLIIISLRLNLSLNWLMRGEGPKRLTEARTDVEFSEELAQRVAAGVQFNLGIPLDNEGARLSADGEALLHLCIAQATEQFQRWRDEVVRITLQRHRLNVVGDFFDATGEHLAALLAELPESDSKRLTGYTLDARALLRELYRDADVETRRLQKLSLVWADASAAVELMPDDYKRQVGEQPLLKQHLAQLVHSRVHRKSARKSERPASRGKPAAKGGRSRKPA